MGTKTVDETGAATGPETKADEETVTATDLTKADPTDDDTTAADAVTDETDEDLEALDGAAGDDSEGPTGVGQGAAAVVSAALGLVSLTGGWIATVASARETLVGQLQTSSTASVAKQVKEVYGDAWHTTALWGGLFALAALLVGVFVLARPAFGAPGKPQAVWIKSVSWAGVALGVIGLLLAVLKYTDVLLGLPSTS
ncbi:hypothetical protein [Streptomyces justiciae]|uniref:hypothetical protein n=1 Tax=Streptomyces justiciae TaxID=2780140 RepID=UPI0021185E8A|nr:hypothetical protein [Streptomyces justiciae]MCW8379286.1 hypothetical protein [Streptomyces justiciae]